jgi:formate dehydrogenase major subunit
VKGVIYFVFMMLGVFMIRVPREDWKPNNWTPSAKPQAPITTHDVEVSAAVRTPQFYLLWIILCVNVTAGIGIIEQASPMIQDLFHGARTVRSKLPRGLPGLSRRRKNERIGASLAEAPVIKEFITCWPVIKQILNRADGTGVEAMSEHTLHMRPKNDGAEVAHSVCPYCAVGCGQLVFHRGNKLISIEGNPASPLSRGRLCPKGADSFELTTHSKRLTKIKYRRSKSTHWEDLDLEKAMDMIANRLWESRNKNFVETQNGQSLMQNKTVAHLGGATLDNEENYLIKKVFTAGLGMVCISNQARI